MRGSGKAASQQLDGSKIEPRLTAGDGPLKVPRQPPITAKPGEGRSTTPGLRCPTIPPGPRQTCSISTGPGRQVATTSYSAANAAGASDHSAFDKNALLRFGLCVWISEQNASVNNLRLRGPSRIVCHGLFRPKLTIFCVTAPTDQGSPPKCLTILDPGAKPDNMIVGRESRSGIAAVGGPGHALCLPGGRIAPSGLPENALDVAGRSTAAAPGFFRGCGGRATSR